MKYLNTKACVILSVMACTLLGCLNDEGVQVGGDSETATKTEPAIKTSVTKGVDSESYRSLLPDSAPIFLVATGASYAPFVMRDTFGNLQGLDVDLIRAIGENQGFKVEFNTMPWVEVYNAIQAENYDIAMSGINIEVEKYANFGISDPYLTDRIQLVTKEGSNITSIEGLIGKSLGVQSGTYLADLAKEVPGVIVREKETAFILFKDLIQDKTDAFLIDKSIILHMAKQFPEYKVHLNDFADQPHQIAFYMNNDNEALLAMINNGLKNIKANGRYKEINKKWFGDSAEELMVP